jgi:hypothetical protein
MNIYLCDNCDTLAVVSVVGDTITLNKCQCSINERETNV